MSGAPFSLLLLTALSAAPADVWPAFRGDGSSVSQVQSLPLTWSKASHVAWTAATPGYGQSSPVVWRERVFVTSADGKNKEQCLVACFDLHTGQELWRKEFASSVPAEVSGYISRAAPTPAVDADQVYAFFETGNLVALDHQGQVAWERSLTDDYGKFLGNHGLGSSLALTGDAVIVLVDHDGPSYLAALDKTNGKTLWKAEREQKVSWSSPIVAGDQIIVSSASTCEAIDARTGKTAWRVDGLDGNTVPSATATESLVIVGSSEVGSNVAIRRGGAGDVSDSHIAWRSDQASATFSSPLVYQGRVYLVNRAGVAFCLDEKTGENLWNHRLGESCWASPLGACGRVYFFAKSGKTTVVEASPELKVLAENELPTEPPVYGVAVVEGRILVRTGSQLTCLADNAEGAKPMDTSKNTASPKASPALPNLPRAITSFGAAVLEDAVYVYGGHHGQAHHYYAGGQSGDLLRLDLKNAAQWETAATGPHLQGLALVAHDGKLYRVGGFEARNQKEEEQSLHSLADFACFNPQSKKWVDLPPMPEPRSSFDAAVLGDTLYVIGGWALAGDKDAAWSETAWAFDLSDDKATWRELPRPPFQRRALAVGAHGGKVYALGGMQPKGEVTRRTAVYDPASRQWSEGPELPGEAMDGFGAACCAAGGRLYASTSSGALLRLAADGKSWEKVRELKDGRFFHRMLPLGDERLLLLGGANMERGKYATVEAASVR